MIVLFSVFLFPEIFLKRDVINNAEPKGQSILISIFNISWKASSLPVKWKKAIIIHKAKPKDPGAM